jgi:hypothetical protein
VGGDRLLEPPHLHEGESEIVQLGNLPGSTSQSSDTPQQGCRAVSGFVSS